MDQQRGRIVDVLVAARGRDGPQHLLVQTVSGVDGRASLADADGVDHHTRAFEAGCGLDGVGAGDVLPVGKHHDAPEVVPGSSLPSSLQRVERPLAAALNVQWYVQERGSLAESVPHLGATGADL